MTWSPQKSQSRFNIHFYTPHASIGQISPSNSKPDSNIGVETTFAIYFLTKDRPQTIANLPEIFSRPQLRIEVQMMDMEAWTLEPPEVGDVGSNKVPRHS
ncbi:hypothetical protein VNO77_18923 [Canavalia gladiata]|uniref:Uncharacterized protein n=1 Tax=Canavalia gladiata TaxID=3824 RepID=A0AAN9LQL3_CANGL